MKRGDIALAVPALALDAHDAAMLREMALTLAAHNIEGYNALPVSDDGHPDTRRWKELRRRDGVRVYKERPSAALLVPVSADAAMNVAKQPNLPVIPSLLLLGSLVGSLEDVMLAVANSTDESVRITSKSVADGLVDAKVLQLLDAPTLADPFHHVSVKWKLYDNNRDYVCLEASGMAETVKGERVGYSVSHSVAFAQLPALDKLGVERGNLSVCSLFLQTSPNTVQCYARGLFDYGSDAKNDFFNGLALNTLAAQWLSCVDYTECALMKKLVWQLRKNSGLAPSGPTELQSPLSGTPTKRRAASLTGGCGVCGKSLGLVLRKRSCKICSTVVCSGCAVKKCVRVLLPDRRSVAEKRRTFCSRCISQVAKSDALTIARDDVRYAMASRLGGSGDTDSEDGFVGTIDADGAVRAASILGSEEEEEDEDDALATDECVPCAA